MTPPPDAAPKPIPPRGALDVLVVTALAVAAFATTLRNGFVWDDVVFLPANPKLAAVRDLRALFGAGFWDFASLSSDSPVYRPLATLLLWAQNLVLGTDPAPYHAVSVLLHAACSALVYLLARRLAPAAPRIAPLAAAALFAVHPVHTEAVAWIVASMHPLATAFALLAAHAQLSHARAGPGIRPAWLLASGAACTAAMLSSEGAFAVPFVLVGLEALETRRRPGATVLAALAAAFALAVLLRARAIGGGVPFTPTAHGIWLALTFAMGYLRQLLVPWPQAIHSTLPPGGFATPANVAVAAIAVAAAAALLWRLPRAERPRPAFALAWIGVTLGPALLAPLNRPLFAPRALYLPSVGLALLVAWAVGRLHEKAPRAVAGGVAALAALGLAACNVASGAWVDDLTVHRAMLESAPRSSGIHLRLGQLLKARGDREASLRHLDAAAALAVDADERVAALEELGVSHGAAGAADLAEPLLREVVATRPSRPVAWIGLGNLAFQRGDLVLARAHYARALALDARSYEALYDLALVHDALGEPALAEAYRARAATVRPAAPSGALR